MGNLLEAEVVDDRLEVFDQRVEREVPDVVVGKAVAALVVAHQRAVPREVDEPVPPHRALPVVVEMGDPVRGAYERRSRPDRRVREACAVRCGAEADLLL